MEFKEGDVFRWSYKDHVKVLGDGSGMRYHCKSRVAIFRNGYLEDTFWSHDCHTVNVDSVDLVYVANLNDFESKPYADLSEYEKGDTLDLRHSNCTSRTKKFVRKGAAKSYELILKNAQNRLIEAQRKHASAYRSVQWAREDLERLTAPSPALQER